MTVRMRSGGQLPWWFGIPFVLGGLLFAGVGATFLLEELRYGSEGVSVTGTVTDLDYSPGAGDDGPTYTIRYGFTDPVAGIDRYGATDVSEEAFDAATIGGPIEVTYLPAEPTRHRVGSPEPQLLFPLAFIGGGGLFAVIGVGMLVLARAMRRNQLPSWVQVTSESGNDQAAAALAQIFGGAGIASAVTGEPGVAAAVPAAPGAPSTPLTEAELAVLDARFAAPPPAPSPPTPTTSPPDSGTAP